MHIINITRAIKNMSINKIRIFIFENYYERIRYSKENCYQSMKHLKRRRFIVVCIQINKKISDLWNFKGRYQSCIRKNIKSVKKSKIITYQPKKFGKSNIVDEKSIIIEQPKTSHKSSKPKRHTEKIGPNCSSYSDTKK